MFFAGRYLLHNSSSQSLYIFHKPTAPSTMSLGVQRGPLGHRVAQQGRSLQSVLVPIRPCCGQRTLSRPSVQTHVTTTNPALTFGLSKAEDAIYEDRRNRNAQIMTMDGTVAKTGLLLGVAVLAASYTWMQVFAGTAASMMAALSAGKVAGIVGFGSALATMFKPQWSPYTALIFAAAKGVALGAFSSIMELRYPGIVLSATMLVLGTAASLLFAYQTRLINVTDNFRNGVMMVTGGYFFVIMASWLLSLLGVSIPSIASGGIVGIGISLVASALAAANLLLDFDMIRQCARQRLPKWMEWYSAFSLMVTLVWMFTEALRLLKMLAGGRDD